VLLDPGVLRTRRWEKYTEMGRETIV